MPDEEDRSFEESVKQSEMDQDAKRKLKIFLERFGSVFPRKIPGLPPKRSFEHEIKTSDDVPVYRSQYRLSPKELDALKEQVAEMLELDLVRPSKSPYSAPILFVKKGDGSLRMVLDYRALNEKTVKDRFPLPRIDDLVDRIGEAKFFSKLDLRSEYYQIRVREEDIPKTAFLTLFGHFELTVMPMGQANSVATFERGMGLMFPESVFGSYLMYYLDDLLWTSASGAFPNTLAMYSRTMSCTCSAFITQGSHKKEVKVRR